MKNIFVGLIALLALLVLAFPSVLPDFIPLIGALDEAAATAVLLACARYFGFDLARFFGSKATGRATSTPGARLMWMS